MPVFPYPPVEEAPPIIFVPPVRETLDWVSPLGDLYRFVIEPGPQGRFMVPVALSLSQAVGRSGDRVDQKRHNGREVMFPIYLAAANAVELRTNVRSLCSLLDPLSGTGQLRNTAIDGIVRDLNCIYSGGLEGDEATERVGPTWFRAVPSFHAADPYWYDTVGVAYLWKTGSPPLFFPFPPLVLGDSSLLEGQTVINDGDVETWPIWTARGPYSRVVIYNQTTGKTLVIDATIDASGWVQVDTRPGFKSVLDHTGENRYEAVASTLGSSLFPLAAGPNLINITVTGSVGNVTQLELLLFRRYLTP